MERVLYESLLVAQPLGSFYNKKSFELKVFFWIFLSLPRFITPCS